MHITIESVTVTKEDGVPRKLLITGSTRNGAGETVGLRQHVINQADVDRYVGAPTQAERTAVLNDIVTPFAAEELAKAAAAPVVEVVEPYPEDAGEYEIPPVREQPLIKETAAKAGGA